MATEVLPDKKLFPSREEIEPWRLVNDARQLFLRLEMAFNLFPEFAIQAALAVFWGKNEVRFEIENHEFNIRHDSKRPTKNKEQVSEGLRVLHYENIEREGKKAKKIEDIWILMVNRPSYGGGDFSDLDISYHSNITVQDGTRFGTDVDHMSETRSEAAIQRIKDFTERVKTLTTSRKTS